MAPTSPRNDIFGDWVRTRAQCCSSLNLGASREDGFTLEDPPGRVTEESQSSAQMRRGTLFKLGRACARRPCRGELDQRLSRNVNSVDCPMSVDGGLLSISDLLIGTVPQEGRADTSRPPLTGPRSKMRCQQAVLPP
ncbi:hypothetical protein H4Q26_006581 [Puccinia striiformis f. sp. tritici PST-130]|uniref:Uncharacterized protein n=2 Tax=Puccinia striiformis TaxID=27350 RepID=A0A0L0UYL2_9BASI|nr:hypothetical protein H4Q26_006581 [Puccinia striiformis f. sp. tritici PST-130]KNE91844.1 hypothetical protein PSTG_14749 [Puccinia striiformis f. sp. tritici PST-78]POW00312.1 hypothetical protein PSTT_13206 [Puccinia striiformis]